MHAEEGILLQAKQDFFEFGSEPKFRDKLDNLIRKNSSMWLTGGTLLDRTTIQGKKDPARSPMLVT